MVAELVIALLLAVVLTWRPSRLLVPADASPQRVFLVTAVCITVVAVAIFAVLRWVQWPG